MADVDEPPATSRSWQWLRHPFAVTTLGGIIVALVTATVSLLVGNASGDGGAVSAPATTASSTINTADGAQAQAGVAAGVLETAARRVDRGRKGWNVALDGTFPRSSWPAPNADCDAVRDWIEEKGGVDAGGTDLQLFIRGVKDHSVVVNDVRARVVAQDGPIDENLVSCTEESGSLFGTRGLAENQGEKSSVSGIGLDLDEETPVARERQSGKLGDLYFSSRILQVAPDEALRLDVGVMSPSRTYSWVIELDVVVDGKADVVTIDDNGRPFVTTAHPARPAHHWLWDATDERPEFTERE